MKPACRDHSNYTEGLHAVSSCYTLCVCQSACALSYRGPAARAAAASSSPLKVPLTLRNRRTQLDHSTADTLNKVSSSEVRQRHLTTSCQSLQNKILLQNSKHESEEKQQGAQTLQTASCFQEHVVDPRGFILM